MGEIRFNIDFKGGELAVSSPAFTLVSPIILCDIDSGADNASVHEENFDICHTTFVCGWQKCGTILFNN
ncbi:MAG: hypothetical protein IJ911_04080 [Salinivirgaceae bacterium]|nr:hypothetical protein [Salinivirgaceae bacterium]